MKRKLKLATLFLLLLPILNGCGDLFDNDSGSYGTITVTPSVVTLACGETQQFTSDQDYITWSLEGATGSSKINDKGLLSVGNDETASTITVRAKTKYTYTKYTDGTAKVTIASPGQTPSGLKVNKPSPNSIQLSWSPMSGVTQYTVQRSTNGKDFGTIGIVSNTSYTDNALSSGASYYYRVQANGVNSQIVYAFANDYFNMPTFDQRKLIRLPVSTKHYYRFPAVSGQSYTIEWQDGNGKDTSSNIRVSAYQNNGTTIFSGVYNGYSNPKVFAANATGFVTVEVWNQYGSANFDYQIYCYGINSNTDSGTVVLPPYKVSAFRVSSANSSSITLTWDPVSDASKYNIYRSNTQNGVLSRIGESSGMSYYDDNVVTGAPYWYTIASVNTDGREGCYFQGAFGFATSYYAMSRYTSTQTLTIVASAKHYYRLEVTQGQSYTIEWQDGNGKDTSSNMRVSAYQNDGTTLFSGVYNGYSNPRVFTANTTGFVTVEVWNQYGSANLNYQIYYY